MSNGKDIEKELQARLGAVAEDNATSPGAAIAASAAAAAREAQSQILDQSNIHPSLRAAAPNTSLVPTANMMPAPAPVEGTSAPAAATVLAAPATGPAQAAPTPMVIDQPQVQPQPGAVAPPPPTDGRKAKRELSQSKRAAQNRAAQRAFRARKESYIKKLESQVRDYEQMEVEHKRLQTLNYQLVDYVFTLQARLQASDLPIPEAPEGALSMYNQAQQAPPDQAPPPTAGAPQPGASNGDNPAARDPTNTALSAMAQLGALPDGLAQQSPPPAQSQQDQSEDTNMEAEVARQLQSEVPQQS